MKKIPRNNRNVAEFVAVDLKIPFKPGYEQEEEVVQDTAEFLKKQFEDALKKKKIRSVIDETILRQLGYEIRQVITHGKFSTLKRAIFFEEDVVVKIISKSQIPEIHMKCYRNELKIIKNLSHKNISKYVTGIETQYKIYLVSTLAQNGNLESFIVRTKYVPEDLAKDFFIDILCALNYCHVRKIAHRNISSENILVTSSYNLMLSDFKFAKIFNSGVPLCEEYKGSYHYTAPEVMNCKPYNPFLADVWSMGVVFFEMLKGEFPFHDLKEENKNLDHFDSKCTTYPLIGAMSAVTLERMFLPAYLRPTIDLLSKFSWISMKLAALNYDDRDPVKRSSYFNY